MNFRLIISVSVKVTGTTCRCKTRSAPSWTSARRRPLPVCAPSSLTSTRSKAAQACTSLAHAQRTSRFFLPICQCVWYTLLCVRTRVFACNYTFMDERTPPSTARLRNELSYEHVLEGGSSIHFTGSCTEENAWVYSCV